jgi:hypothetical protein
MRCALIALAGAVALTGAAPAFAQNAPDRADARCILVLSLAAREPKNREKVSEGIFYFLGKLTARGQGARLTSVLAQEAKSPINAQQAQAELNRCGQELTRSSAQLNGAFKTLQASAPRRPASPPPVANPFTAPPK